jgi:DNA-binding IclR family transcriptional regulator
MLEELSLTRERGYAHSCDEMELGTTSVASPIRDSAGAVVAALGVAGPTERMHRLSIARLVQAVVSCSAEISDKLGQLKRVRAPLASPFPHNGSAGLSGR